MKECSHCSWTSFSCFERALARDWYPPVSNFNLFSNFAAFFACFVMFWRLFWNRFSRESRRSLIEANEALCWVGGKLKMYVCNYVQINTQQHNLECDSYCNKQNNCTRCSQVQLRLVAVQFLPEILLQQLINQWYWAVASLLSKNL